MKTIYRVLLVTALFAITLVTAEVNPRGSIYAVGARRFDSVEVVMAQGDDLFAVSRRLPAPSVSPACSISAHPRAVSGKP